jgi:hypothetical protein
VTRYDGMRRGRWPGFNTERGYKQNGTNQAKSNETEIAILVKTGSTDVEISTANYGGRIIPAIRC